MSSRQSLPRTTCEDTAREAVLCSQEGGKRSWSGEGVGEHPTSRWKSGRGSCSRGIEGPDGANDPNPKGSEGAKIGVGELGHRQHGVGIVHPMEKAQEAGTEDMRD